MLIADVSKTMGDLAVAISKKNRELQHLKAEYAENLSAVQRYLELIRAAGCPQSAEEFVELIKKPVQCGQCGSPLHDLMKDAEYVLVPKRPLHVLGSGERGPAGASTPEVPTQKRLEAPTQAPEAPTLEAPKTLEKPVPPKTLEDPEAPAALRNWNVKLPVDRPVRHGRGRLKRTCSYCGKTGHSRSRCFSRLSKEPGSHK